MVKYAYVGNKEAENYNVSIVDSDGTAFGIGEIGELDDTLFDVYKDIFELEPVQGSEKPVAGNNITPKPDAIANDS